MSDKNAKDIRKQVRNVVNEVLPSLLQTEVFSELYVKLQREMNARLDEIRRDVATALERMDSRSKDVQQYIINHVQMEMARNHAVISDAPKPGEMVPTAESQLKAE